MAEQILQPLDPGAPPPPPAAADSHSAATYQTPRTSQSPYRHDTRPKGRSRPSTPTRMYSLGEMSKVRGTCRPACLAGWLAPPGCHVNW